MKIEIMIYCYGIICASMIIFNLLCVFHFKSRQERTLNKSKYFSDHIKYQISLIEQEKTLNDKEYEYLIKKLKKVGNLFAFDCALEEVYNTDKETAERYISELHRVFLILADNYLKKEDIQSAFFLHIINKYRVTGIIKFDVLINIIKRYFKKPSVYCCLNVMEALCISGDPDHVVEGLIELNGKEGYYCSKVIARELRMYSGDFKELSEILINKFDLFSIEFKNAVLEYFTSSDADNNEFVYSLMTDDRQDDEIRYSAIRYFGKHKFIPALDVLKDIIKTGKDKNWIYVAQAITAISSYSDSEVVQILKACLSSSDWYSRYNAAKGLERQGVSYNDLADIINGNDRYAIEIVTYMSEHKSLHEIEQKETVLA